MRKSFICLLAALIVSYRLTTALAQCPTILNCPQGNINICDLSDNDSLLWHEPPYTWCSTLGLEDLYEGTADFSLKILPCGFGNLNISYVLLLDLDNDNLMETAVSSNNPPPAGFVFANNAFNPGYTGGEPLEFDKRPLPDTEIFQFALETTNVWDTVVASLRWKTGNFYVLPRLPEGRHKLMWWVEQAGEVDYCEYTFRVKDCLAPALTCEPDWSISIEADSTAAVSLNDILLDVEDNTTPSYQLRVSMRKANDGVGFPLDSFGNSVTELQYECLELGTHIIEVWAKDRWNNEQPCLTTLTINDDNGICNLYPTLCARPFWDTTKIMKLANFMAVWVDTSQQLHSHTLSKLPDSCGQMSSLPPANAFSLMAERDSNYLNGVSTFDLLQISKHILGIQLFDAPWKWIAADANRSNSVTTFDIVELRKLILGIYADLPANTSWRFFVADCTFPPVPFDGYCASEYSFITTPNFSDYPHQMNFNGVKIGDVNATANLNAANAPAESRGTPPTFFQLPDMDLKAGETYEIPLRTLEADALLGFQFSLHFDSEIVEIENVSLGSLPGLDENSFAQPEIGALNVSWFNPTPQVILPDENLLVLKVKSLRSAPLSAAVQMKNEKLPAEAYTAGEAIHPLQIHFSKNEISAAKTAIFPPQPNPTSAGADIPIRLSQPEIVRVEVADFSGKIIFQNEIPLESGSQMLEIPASVFSQAGVYCWQVKTRQKYESGKLVKF